jgi:phage terminase large subunit-like protein
VTEKLADALDLLAGLVLEDGRRWGDAASDFQREDAEHVLDPDSPTPYNYLTRSRGGAKTSDLAGMTVAAMLAQAPVGARLYGVAADRDQARLKVDSIGGFVARTPELRGTLDVQAFRVVAPRTGAVLEILAADAESAWGIRPWFLDADELAQWATTPGPRRLWEAVSSAAAKVPGARLVVLTTAGDPSHWSYKVLQHAKVDRLWRVNEVPGPPPWADPERLAEQRRRLPESSYRRLFENIWTAPEDRLTTLDDLAACAVLDGPLPPKPRTSYVLTLDVGIVHDRTAAVVAHAETITGTNGSTIGVRVVIDRVHVWAGSRANPVQLVEVGEWVEFVAKEYNGATVVFDPHQAIELTQRLARRGARVIKFDFTAASVARLALALYEALRNRTLAIPNDPDLLDELGSVRLKETSPGIFRLDHDPDKHDDRAVAVAMAAERLLSRPPSRPGTVSVPRGRIPGVVARDPLEDALARVGIASFASNAATIELSTYLARGRS